MQQFTKFCLGLFTSSTIFLTGCQHFQKPPVTTAQTPQAPNIQNPITQFELQGKIGVRTPQQSGSAFFTWQQLNDHFEIDLTGALGMGKTHIEGQTGQVSLTSAKTGTITADSPEELLAQATGWQAPITNLVQWVQAKPATPNAKIQYDAEQRPTQFIEDGWEANLSYNNQIKLPNKLILKQLLENGQENRITMVIQNR